MKREHLEKSYDVDAFIHSFDFTSLNHNIFTRPNAFKFIKNNIKSHDQDKLKYFLINIKKIYLIAKVLLNYYIIFIQIKISLNYQKTDFLVYLKKKLKINLKI